MGEPALDLLAVGARHRKPLIEIRQLSGDHCRIEAAERRVLLTVLREALLGLPELGAHALDPRGEPLRRLLPLGLLALVLPRDVLGGDGVGDLGRQLGIARAEGDLDDARERRAVDIKLLEDLVDQAVAGIQPLALGFRRRADRGHRRLDQAPYGGAPGRHLLGVELGVLLQPEQIGGAPDHLARPDEPRLVRERLDLLGEVAWRGLLVEDARLGADHDVRGGLVGCGQQLDADHARDRERHRNQEERQAVAPQDLRQIDEADRLAILDAHLRGDRMSFMHPHQADSVSGPIPTVGWRISTRAGSRPALCCVPIRTISSKSRANRKGLGRSSEVRGLVSGGEQNTQVSRSPRTTSTTPAEHALRAQSPDKGGPCRRDPEAASSGRRLLPPPLLRGND